MVYLVFALLALPVDAATSPTDVIERGMKGYLESGASGAIKGWLVDSALEGDKQAMMQAALLSQIESMYGKPLGYDVVAQHEITDRVQVILFVMNFEKGPVFANFQLYRRDSGNWIAASFRFHTEASMVWPEKAIYTR